MRSFAARPRLMRSGRMSAASPSCSRTSAFSGILQSSPADARAVGPDTRDLLANRGSTRDGHVNTAGLLSARSTGALSNLQFGRLRGRQEVFAVPFRQTVDASES